MIDPCNVGINVIKHRNELGLSQEALARQVDITKGHLYKIEAGAATPSIALLIRLANFFDVGACDLLYLRPPKRVHMRRRSDSLEEKLLTLDAEAIMTITNIIYELKEYNGLQPDEL